MSTSCTKYRTYSDKELLNLTEERCRFSPLMQELWTRLADRDGARNANGSTYDTPSGTHQCPVCEAELDVSQNSIEVAT